MDKPFIRNYTIVYDLFCTLSKQSMLNTFAIGRASCNQKLGQILCERFKARVLTVDSSQVN